MTLRRELEDLSGQTATNAENTAEAIDQQASAAKSLAQVLSQASSTMNNMETVSRLFPGQVNQLGAAALTPPQTSVLADTERNVSGRMRGLLRQSELAGSNRELGRQMGDLEDQSKSAFSAVQLGAQAATSATNALTQSLARGESFARGLQGTFSQLLSQVGSSLLQKAITGGSALGLTGGPLAAIGIGGGLLGGILGSFDRGGIVDTPFQVVGESGPELAALPQGTHISTARETQQLLQAQRTVNVVAEIKRLANGDLGIAVNEAEKRSSLYQRRHG
jgi:hypothetical protein